MIAKIIFIVTILLYYEVESKEDKILSELGQTNEQNRAWHRTSAFLLAIMTIPLAYVIFGISWACLVALIFAASARMSYFNIRLNARRGKPLFYLGTQGWDKLFKKVATPYFITNIIITIITILIIILC